MNNARIGIVCQSVGVAIALAAVTTSGFLFNSLIRLNGREQSDLAFTHVHEIEYAILGLGGLVLGFILFRTGKRIKSKTNPA